MDKVVLMISTPILFLIYFRVVLMYPIFVPLMIR